MRHMWLSKILVQGTYWTWISVLLIWETLAPVSLQKPLRATNPTKPTQQAYWGCLTYWNELHRDKGKAQCLESNSLRHTLGAGSQSDQDSGDNAEKEIQAPEEL